jgi:hypothetical protein
MPVFIARNSWDSIGAPAYEPRVRKRGTELLVVVTLLVNDGSGCRLTAVFGLVMMLSSEGIGASVGRGLTAIGSAALEEVVVAPVEEKIDAGLGAWDNNAHPIRKDSTLVIVIQIRKANFNGFMDDSFLEPVVTLLKLNRSVLGDANDAALL